MLRVISEVRPRWVVAENVAGLVSLQKGVVLDTVLSDLEGKGYHVQPFIVPACSVNAPHRRDRVWIVANSTQQLPHRAGNAGPGRRKEYSDGGGNAAHSQSNGLQKRRLAQHRDKAGQFAGGDVDATNPSNQRLQGGKRQRSHEERQAAHGSTAQRHNPWHEHWHDVALRTCVRRVHNGVSRRLDRTARLKALGNAIVPQVAEQIFKAIKEADE